MEPFSTPRVPLNRLINSEDYAALNKLERERESETMIEHLEKIKTKNMSVSDRIKEQQFYSEFCAKLIKAENERAEIETSNFHKALIICFTIFWATLPITGYFVFSSMNIGG